MEHLHSMTGYGESSFEKNGHLLQVSIKTLNSKYLDIQCTLPVAWAHEELSIRKTLSNHLKRGKVKLTLHYQAPPLHVVDTQKEALKNYYHLFVKLSQELDTSVSTLATLFPATHLLPKPNPVPPPISNHELQATLLKAVEKCVESRQQFHEWEQARHGHRFEWNPTCLGVP